MLLRELVKLYDTSRMARLILEKKVHGVGLLDTCTAILSRKWAWDLFRAVKMTVGALHSFSFFKVTKPLLHSCCESCMHITACFK